MLCILGYFVAMIFAMIFSRMCSCNRNGFNVGGALVGESCVNNEDCTDGSFCVNSKCRMPGGASASGASGGASGGASASGASGGASASGASKPDYSDIDAMLAMSEDIGEDIEAMAKGVDDL